MNESAVIFHIARNVDWPAPDKDQEYRCASLQEEGFIHCCEKSQLAGVVRRYYSDVDDVQLLTIAVNKLAATVVRENTVGGDELFPHVYGTINKDAVISTAPFGIHSTERKALFS